MSEEFKLVFRGDLAEGQHPAVVRRKLAQLLALDEPQLERLFSGQVVVKARADRQTAERLEALFRKAGAHLHREAVAPVQPLPEAPAADPEARTQQAEPGRIAGQRTLDVELLPVGSDVLREDERAPWQPRHVETSHLDLLARDAQLEVSGPPPPPLPDTSRLRLVDPDEPNRW